MSVSFVFHANAEWISGAHGEVLPEPHANLHGEPVAFDAPPEFRGPQGLWSPEHLLIAAAGTCFVTTFRAIAAISRLPFDSISVAVEGTVVKVEGGYKFTQLVLKPTLRICHDADADRALRLLHKTEGACLVARSLNCEVTMQSVITATDSSWSKPETEREAKSAIGSPVH